MKKGQIRRWIYTREFLAATAVVTLGDWWAARAAARLETLRKYFFKGI